MQHTRPSAINSIEFPAHNIAAGAGADEVIQSLARLRREIADAWLRLPADELQSHYEGRIGKTHQMVCRSDLQLQPASPEDVAFRQQLWLTLRNETTPRTGTLLAALLYMAPHEMPRFAEIPALPAWFQPEYVQQMLRLPPLFRYAGESDAYLAFMRRWVRHLWTVVLNNQHDNEYVALAQTFGAASHFHSAYFNWSNLRELFRQRADILALSLEAIHYQLDWKFPARTAQARLRLGIYALDFKPRTETFATLPVFRDLDRNRFEVILFAPHFGDSPMEKLCAQYADRVVQLPAGLQSQVGVLREADLDFLFIGTNVTAAATDATALTLHRLARVQIASICCCVTTGMRNVDCFLSGLLSEPVNAQAHYTEKLYLLDGPAHCFDFGGHTPDPAGEALRREDFGIPANAIVFASGANFHKILPELETVWLRILAAVPDSRLLLYPFNPNWDSYSVAAFMARLGSALQSHGIETGRVIVLDAAPAWNDVLRRLHMADIYLDSFPFCGATSLLDPLLCGLPTICMDGAAHRGIQGPAVLRSLGLGEWVAGNIDHYIRLAIRLAVDRRRRRALSTRIGRLMRSQPAILDHAGYGKQVAGALERMWEDYGRGDLAVPEMKNPDIAKPAD